MMILISYFMKIFFYKLLQGEEIDKHFDFSHHEQDCNDLVQILKK